MKLAILAASAAGATLALVGIGYVDGIFNRDELLAIIGALIIGAYLWNKLEG